MSQETKRSLRETLTDLDEERSSIVARKKTAEADLAELSAEIRKKKHFSPDKYSKFLNDQQDLKREISVLEARLSQINVQRRKVNDLIFSVQADGTEKKEKEASLRRRLVDIRDKYIEFGSDNTRVSSMRLMATQFAQEIEGLLSSER